MRRKTEDPKVTWSLKSSKALLEELDKEAKANGKTRSEIANDRLRHYATPLTPELLVLLQDKGIEKYEQMKADQPEEAVKIVEEVMKLWNRLK